VHRQAVPPPRRLRCQDTGIDNTAHAVEEVLGDASTVALDNVAGPHALSSDNVALLAGCLLCQQCDMGTAARIIFDALDKMRSRCPPIKVNGPDSSLHTTTAMPDGDFTRVVSATLAMPLLGKCQRKVRPALPEMIVDGALEMTGAGCPRLVCSHLYRFEIGLDSTGEGASWAVIVAGCRRLEAALYFGRIISRARYLKGALAY